MTFLKGCTVILLLAVSFLILRHIELIKDWTNKVFQPNGTGVFLRVESNYKENSPITMPDDFCTFKPPSSADAEEECLLLGSIAWPETPLLPSPFSLNQTSDPAHSSFTVLPGRGGGAWHVGDQMEVVIKMHDFNGNGKKSGGDFLIVRLHNKELDAGVAGRVVDHLNGSYSAVFTLLWEGKAQVEVKLVHPSEAVTVLHRLAREQPDRIYFKGVFSSGKISQTTTCNVCLRQINQPLCNFTDLRTGAPWFCYKPQNLSCDTRVGHGSAGIKQELKAKEETLFQKKVNLKVSIKGLGPAYVTVLPPRKGKSGVDQRSQNSGLSGYYYKGVWRSLGATKVQHFNNASTISECLKGKTVRLYGDSTIRQWYEYLDSSLPDAKAVNLDGQKQTGPFMMWDNEKKILVTYQCHGPPLRFRYIPTSQLRYIASEIDGLVGGTNTVVVISIWAHFTSFPVEIYIRRLQSIRRAVVSLLKRAPRTRVVIRTGNLKDLNLFQALTTSDWYAFQRDKVLRAMFKGVNVQMVDAWEMTLAHHLPHDLHPKLPIIKNMVDVLLSYICP